MGYVFIAGTIILTVVGQLLFKWQVDLIDPLPAGMADKAKWFFFFMLKPWVILAYSTALGASICWMGALSKFDLSYAYPFMSLTFGLTLICSVVFFHEAFTMTRVVGVLLIMGGVAVSSQ